MSIAIKIENLSKQYRLGLVSTRTLSHDLNRWWQTSILGREDPYIKIGETNIRESKGTTEYVWALKDINLEVEEGEVLGIIGKNGAGKSTLLKILSKVTAPTTGIIKARGRIASLLEVGTGFHQEMTGRENIYMNGAIMGMTKKEITRKLDEIVDFAGVERYIDTPVKRYSSGMTVRLGFAVAAHLEPEILVVDEVLAVGDAEFQKKAIGKMQDLTHKEGRTVLFVSHNLNSISLLCNRAILLENGKIIFSDKTEIVISKYIENSNSLTGQNINLKLLKRAYSEICFKNLTFNRYPIRFGDLLNFTIKLESIDSKKFEDLEIGIGIQDSSQKRIIHISNKFINKIISHKSNSQEYLIEIENNLAPGIYGMTLFLKANEIIQDWIQDKIQFEITDGNPYKFTNTKLITGIVFPAFDILQI